MSKELLVSHTSGTNVYATLRIPINRSGATGGTDQISGNIGKWFNQRTLSFETFVAGNFVDYDIALTELGDTGLFEGDMPAEANPEKALEVIYWDRAGANPVMGDTKITGLVYEFLDEWVPTSTIRV